MSDEGVNRGIVLQNRRDAQRDHHDRDLGAKSENLSTMKPMIQDAVMCVPDQQSVPKVSLRQKLFQLKATAETTARAATAFLRLVKSTRPSLYIRGLC